MHSGYRVPRRPFLDRLRPSLRRIVCSFVVVVLSACTSLQQVAPTAGDQPLAVGPGYDYFALSGRLSVREGQRVEIAGLRWERTSKAESVTLSSPIGSTVARLWKDEQGMAHLKAGDREVSATDLEALIADAVGTPVPLAALGWWIQGLEARPGSGKSGLRGESSAAFTHEGWDIRIEEFPLSQSVPVARRIVARKGETTLRLVIDAWEPRS